MLADEKHFNNINVVLKCFYYCCCITTSTTIILYSILTDFALKRLKKCLEKIGLSLLLAQRAGNTTNIRFVLLLAEFVYDDSIM